ncbi:SIMPL domain-containing protein [Actinoplanes sp. NPDC026670]|uniref:SIMPL domain-containing protein n=1 Tax=Actinoplanes sp. NPDC026670 TaxID=3154700 RepID=UPI0033DAE3E4
MIRSRATVPALVALTASGVLSSALAAPSQAFAASRPTYAVGNSFTSGVSSAARPSAFARPSALVRPSVLVRPGSADPAWESVLVTGTGEVFGEPDTLTADLAVETTAPTVGAALDQAVTAATRTRDALIRAGVARVDLQTTNVSISSTQDENGKITGYTVNQGLTVTIRNLSKAGSLMTAAIKAGGDAARLNGVSFAIEKNTDLIAEARRKAFADAKAKAELYAREAGRPLGRVVKISEPTYGYGEPVHRDKMSTAMAAMDASVPIEPGRQRLSITVTVEWILAPAAGKA